MSKFFSLSLSLLILTQSFGIKLNDITKIDEFIEHAQFHNEQYGDNVFVFISKHYGALKSEHNQQHREEKEDHDKLPFQHHSQISGLVYFVLNTLRIEAKTIEFSEFTKHDFFFQASLSSLHLEGLLQPPRHS